MQNLQKILTLSVFLIAAALIATIWIPRKDISSANPPSPATQASAHDKAAITAQLDDIGPKLDEVFPSLDSVVKPEFREKDAAAALPILEKVSALFAQLAAASNGPDKEMAAIAQTRYEAAAASLGSAAATKAVNAEANSSDSDIALRGVSAQALVQWWSVDKDPAAQKKILDGYIGRANGSPSAAITAETLYIMARVGAADDALSKQAVNAIKTLTSDHAKEVLGEIADTEEQDAEASALEKELAKYIGESAQIDGRTSTGGHFSASALKGKVTLIDFWATWCVPCVAEMPALQRLYDRYNQQGFQIVGVSDDDSEEKLNAFIKSHGIPWVQLHDAAAQSGDDERNPVQISYGIKLTPWMFLIDREGIIRYVDASTNTEEKIKTLLAEKSTGK